MLFRSAGIPVNGMDLTNLNGWDLTTDDGLDAFIDYVITNPDWVMVALNRAGQAVMDAEENLWLAQESLKTAESAAQSYQETYLLWQELQATVENDPAFTPYQGVLLAYQAAAKDYYNILDEYNKALSVTNMAKASWTSATEAAEAAQAAFDKLQTETDVAQWELDEAAKANSDAITAAQKAKEAYEAAEEKSTALSGQAATKRQQMEEAQEKVSSSEYKAAFDQLLWNIQHPDFEAEDGSKPNAQYAKFQKILKGLELQDYATIVAHVTLAEENVDDIGNILERAKEEVKIRTTQLGYDPKAPDADTHDQENSAWSKLVDMAEIANVDYSYIRTDYYTCYSCGTIYTGDALLAGHRCPNTIHRPLAKYNTETRDYVCVSENCGGHYPFSQLLLGGRCPNSVHAQEAPEAILTRPQSLISFQFQDRLDSKSELQKLYETGKGAYEELSAALNAGQLNLSRVGDTLRSYLNTLTASTSSLTSWVAEEAYTDDSISSNVASVFGAMAFTSAVTEEGYVYMWGDNGKESRTGGVLGNRESTGLQAEPSLMYRKEFGTEYMGQVVRLSTVSGNMDYRHVLAHRTTGYTYAWGNNRYGQLGNQTTTSNTVPTVVGSGKIYLVRSTYYLDISRGGLNTQNIAVRDDSKGYLMVYADGKTDGLYQWKSLDTSIVRVTPSGVNSSTAILTAVREGETRVLVENVVTGQIVFARVIVTDGVTYPQLTLGRDTSTALKKNGTVWAWGDNTYREVNLEGTKETNESFGDYTGVTTGVGKLGVGSKQSLITVPVQLSYYLESPTSTTLRSFQRITKIANGDSHSLAVDFDGNVYAWGDNTYGQLGLNPTQVKNTDYPIRLDIRDANGEIGRAHV